MGLISNGTTVFDAGAMSLGGSMTFIKKLTASSSGTLSFVNGSSGVTAGGTAGNAIDGHSYITYVTAGTISGGQVN